MIWTTCSTWAAGAQHVGLRECLRSPPHWPHRHSRCG
jgi:hypothetical protein